MRSLWTAARCGANGKRPAAMSPWSCPQAAHRRSHADGGYGWVVVASCFTVTGLTAAMIKSFGVFFVDFQDYFNEPATMVSWVSSICVAVFHLACPIASALSSCLSHRAVIMLGGLLVTLGASLGSLAWSLPWMYVTTGVVLGLGISLAWVPAQSMVNQYFSERRALANALASSGECVFIFSLTPMFQWLVTIMSWRGAMLIIAGIQLNLCVCGALMRPYKHVEPRPGTRGPLLDLSLLRLPEFICVAIFSLLTVMAFFVPSIYLIPFAQSNGVDQLSATFLVSYWAVTDLTGRLSCGWLANLALVKNIQLLAVMVAILTVGLLLMPSATSYTSMVALSCFCGFFFGAMISLLITVLIDIVGVSKVDSGLGIAMLLRGFGCLCGPPLAGLLVDATADFGSSFYLTGGALFVSVVFLLLADFFMKRNHQRSEDQHVVGTEGVQG
ncbi:monocarboxylate transporter 7-like isoform X1 [Erpetoichthys calabaricus]|uniref:monocarboxylate transporter 7-like isoform X1 n=2 Tax=Erpetoichthys calabaricus TaxID=27687 RepID=UPI002233E335|nr:monocarboxylate transporter 7-like isoform X1 [Erpetoichthys calabaricus]XP_051788701.1 monocarboxylate transporter 7-like isoform X1 [Erpetoichthys calabaricus]